MTAATEQSNPGRENTRKNVSAICKIEEEALSARSLGERLGDAIARHAGRIWFISAHAVWFGLWIAVNTGLLPVRPFDPFPFQFLTFVVWLEAIFLFAVHSDESESGSKAGRRSRIWICRSTCWRNKRPQKCCNSCAACVSIMVLPTLTIRSCSICRVARSLENC